MKLYLFAVKNRDATAGREKKEAYDLKTLNRK
jgi:hypothetical protein